MRPIAVGCTDRGVGQQLNHPSAGAASRAGRASPRREWLDTVLVDPEESVEVAFVADNPGDWLFHCHILEPMEAGMFATLRVA